MGFDAERRQPGTPLVDLDKRISFFGSFSYAADGNVTEPTPYGVIKISEALKHDWMKPPLVSHLFRAIYGEYHSDVLVVYCARAHSQELHPLESEYIWTALLRDTGICPRVRYVSPSFDIVYASFTRMQERFLVYDCDKHMVLDDYIRFNFSTYREHLIDCCRVGISILEATEKLHHMGVVHGNLVVSSILVDRPSSSVKLTQFHKARFASQVENDYADIVRILIVCFNRGNTSDELLIDIGSSATIGEMTRNCVTNLRNCVKAMTCVGLNLRDTLERFICSI